MLPASAEKRQNQILGERCAGRAVLLIWRILFPCVGVLRREPGRQRNMSVFTFDFLLFFLVLLSSHHRHILKTTGVPLGWAYPSNPITGSPSPHRGAPHMSPAVATCSFPARILSPHTSVYIQCRRDGVSLLGEGPPCPPGLWPGWCGAGHCYCRDSRVFFPRCCQGCMPGLHARFSVWSVYPLAGEVAPGGYANGSVFCLFFFFCI